MPFARSLLLSASLFLAGLALAQGKFTVNGRMKVDGGDLSGARAVVYKEGVKERTITTALSKIALALELNTTYVISFEKDGFVSKKISFDTHVPAEAAANGFTPFDFAVSLFKQYDDINLVVFNQPVGMIRYSSTAGDFDYDTDYTKSIQSQLQEVVEQVEKKQKEEARQAEEEEKRRNEEARSQARSQEEAAKRLAAEKASQERAQAEAERKAAAEQATKAREQAETERAEKARQESTRKEEEKRKATEAAAIREQPKAKPAPAVPDEKPRPLPVRPAPVRNSLASKPTQGEEGRRTIRPVMGEEVSRVQKARTNSGQEERPEKVAEGPVTNRTEDLIVESSKVTTVIKLETEGATTEYRKVFHKWGGIFYFKNGEACTQMVYDRETSAEQLAGATPRSKLE